MRRPDNTERLADAQERAAEIRARNFPLPCDCQSCTLERNLPAVMRIVEKRAEMGVLAWD